LKSAKSAIESADHPGFIVWDNAWFDYQTGDCPPTVNPSLWRQAKLNHLWGLYHVTDKIYQIRSLGLSTMTIIEADEGLIIIDPTMSFETAKAAMELYYKHKSQ
jgi:alkyl sulfatase BDS1-like metallo-beta-lactamase superfamily hydrolase